MLVITKKGQAPVFFVNSPDTRAATIQPITWLGALCYAGASNTMDRFSRSSQRNSADLLRKILKGQKRNVSALSQGDLSETDVIIINILDTGVPLTSTVFN